MELHRVTPDCMVDSVQDLQHVYRGKEMKLQSNVKRRMLRINVPKGTDVSENLRSICQVAKQLSVANGPMNSPIWYQGLIPAHPMLFKRFDGWHKVSSVSTHHGVDKVVDFTLASFQVEVLKKMLNSPRVIRRGC